MPQRLRPNLRTAIREQNLSRWERIGWIALLDYFVLALIFAIFTVLLGIPLPEPWQTVSPYAEVAGNSLWTIAFLVLVTMFALRCMPRRWHHSWQLWLALGVIYVWGIAGQYDSAAHVLPGHILPTLTDVVPGLISVLGIVDQFVWLLLVIPVLVLPGWLRRRQGNRQAPPLTQSEG